MNISAGSLWISCWFTMNISAGSLWISCWLIMNISAGSLWISCWLTINISTGSLWIARSVGRLISGISSQVSSKGLRYLPLVSVHFWILAPEWYASCGFSTFDRSCQEAKKVVIPPSIWRCSGCLTPRGVIKSTEDRLNLPVSSEKPGLLYPQWQLCHFARECSQLCRNRIFRKNVPREPSAPGFRQKARI